jgi:hypothetical protein
VVRVYFKYHIWHWDERNKDTQHSNQFSKCVLQNESRVLLQCSFENGAYTVSSFCQEIYGSWLVVLSH